MVEEREKRKRKKKEAKKQPVKSPIVGHTMSHFLFSSFMERSSYTRIPLSINYKGNIIKQSIFLIYG